MKYKGQELNKLHVIIVRFICAALIYPLGAIMTALLFIGWGSDHAAEFWERL